MGLVLHEGGDKAVQLSQTSAWAEQAGYSCSWSVGTQHNAGGLLDLGTLTLENLPPFRGKLLPVGRGPPFCVQQGKQTSEHYM